MIPDTEGGGGTQEVANLKGRSRQLSLLDTPGEIFLVVASSFSFFTGSPLK